ncbi:MAG: NAD(P)H-hydrate dehydratase [Elusimicrobiaceae bacterium]|nr:NAD(P)H-hydrate dehydratase [Elusimicrobiaceae bacterium]
MKKITRSVVARLLPVRAENAHKGTFGRVLIIAGSRTMCGAGLLCAKSALRAGAGLVYWALPQTMQDAFAAALPEVITVPLAETTNGEIAAEAWPELKNFIAEVNPSVVVAGPGMGNSPLLAILLREIQTPLLVDADGLNAAARLQIFSYKPPVIFTPHPGEMARLLQMPIAMDAAAREEQARQLAAKIGGVCVLKGHPTLVGMDMLNHILLWQNSTGGPALAKGGSGDVLSGLIAGLWSQAGSQGKFDVISAFQMAACAVYIHGLAGDLAAQQLTDYGVLASDTVDYVPAAIKKILQEKK